MKRLIALIAAFAMIVSSVTIVSARSVSADGSESVAFLTELGIIKNWNSESKINRAEFLNAAIRCVLRDSGSVAPGALSEPCDSGFVDVPSEYYAAYNISVAKNMGIVSGSDGYFSPDAPISLAEALKIAVASAGYDYIAAAKGGWQTGYAAAAATLGMTDGLSVADYNSLTMGEAAVLLKNLLMTPTADYDYSGSGKFELNRSNDTFLYKVHDILDFEGIVTADEFSAIDSKSAVSDGYVKIRDAATGESTVFKLDGIEGLEIGRRFQVFYSDNGAQGRVLKAVLAAANAKEERVDGDDITEFDSSKRRLTAETATPVNRWDYSTQKSYFDIPVTMNVLKNGVFLGDHTAAFKILNGETDENIDYLDFFDTDGDGKYDTVNMRVYRTLYVSDVSEDDMRLVLFDDYTKQEFRADYDERETVVKYKDGAVNNAAKISAGDTAAVFEADCEPKKAEIYISGSSVTEKIITVSEDEFSTENADYKLSATLKKYYDDCVTAGRESFENSLSLGADYKICTDFNGKAAAVVRTDGKYGNFVYINDIAQNGSGMNTSIDIELSSLDGKYEVVSLADSVQIADDTLKTGSISDVSSCEALVNLKGKLAEIRRDSDGEINRINPIYNDTQTELLRRLCGTSSVAPRRMKYKSYQKVFYDKTSGNTVMIDSKTKILFVPHPDIASSVGDISDWFYTSADSVFQNDNYYYLAAYAERDTDVVADVLICFDKNETQISSNNGFVVVESVRRAVDEDGNEVMQMTGYIKKRQVKYLSAEKNFTTIDGSEVKLGSGDVIMVTLDNKDKVREVNLLYDNDGTYNDVTAEYSSLSRCLRGSVYSVDGSSFYMVKNKWDITDADITADNMEPHLVNSSAAVLVCDTKNSKITVGSIADLVGYSAAPRDYSKIVVANVTAVPNTYIVYK